MAEMSTSDNPNNTEALFAHRKKNFRFEKEEFKKHDNDGPGESSSHYKKKFKCHRCGKPGHIKRFCTVKLNSRNYVRKNGGSYDSSDESKFSILQPHTGNEAMVTADNTVHKVENEGTVVINDGCNDSITLNNVFHVPGMKKKLFSVPNAVDTGYNVLFGPHDVKFLKNVKYIKADVMHTGRRVKDTFVLSASSSYIDKVSCNENVSLWHARLGHVNFDKLKAMVRKNLVNVGVENCL
ncbi:uncharacterized protein LOC109838540 [Asparagus officinalis]|uniref:uncharacterized protein LOC109838540 n=1 Tax=Asparagus officinalis TaxID=4686 RepID=UPI00098E4AE5|nr:uncharacterized protein LOC109838540 [Asparagus officinalis]